MRQIVIIAFAYGITPLLMALTVLLAWWLATRDNAYGEGEG
jgi:glucose-6-phosphate dehydrogenase assembly protein OpcA